MAQKPAASTSTDSSNTIAASTKRTIQQLVPSNSIKKGPYAIERAVDPKDLVIKRRPDEGSKPLFERDDISINRQNSNDCISSPAKIAQRPTRRQSSSSSSSAEHCIQRDPTYSSQTTSTKTKLKNLKRRIPEKIPYFLDEKREQERLIRTYGASITVGSLKRDEENSKTNLSRSLSRSSNFTSHSKSTSSFFKKHKHSKQQNYAHDRHFARSRHRSPHENERQRHRSLSNERRTRRHRRSKTRSRSRSHSKDRHKRARSTERHGGREHAAPKPTTQIITIPVPIDPYGYPAAYAAWSHQPAWPAAAQGAPRFAAPYPMPPVMPSYVGPAMFPPYRPPPPPYGPPPPPYGMPFTPRFFRPPRFASRSFRGNFRPRNY